MPSCIDISRFVHLSGRFNTLAICAPQMALWTRTVRLLKLILRTVIGTNPPATFSVVQNVTPIKCMLSAKQTNWSDFDYFTGKWQLPVTPHNSITPFILLFLSFWLDYIVHMWHLFFKVLLSPCNHNIRLCGPIYSVASWHTELCWGCHGSIVYIT